MPDVCDVLCNVKVKFLLCLIRYHAVKTCGKWRYVSTYFEFWKDDGKLSNSLLLIKQIVLFCKRRSCFSFMLSHHPPLMKVYGGIHARVLNIVKR